MIEKKIKNFLIILNKIDLSSNPIHDIDSCKGFLINSFPKFKTFNLNLNTFIPISAYQVENELLMEENFSNFIKYHFYNYKKKIMEKKLKNEKEEKTFIGHLRDILKYIGKSKLEIESQVDDLNNNDNILKINEEIKKLINYLYEISKGEDLKLGIQESDFDKNEEDNEEDDLFSSIQTKSHNDNNIDDVEPASVIKIFYILQKQKQLIPPISSETLKLLNYFSNKREDINDYNENDAPINNVALNNQIIDALKIFYDEFKASEVDLSQIKNLSNEIQKLIEYLKIYDVIFIPFLGASNAGKSTIINGIIGKDLLPCDLKECTKRGIIIRYTDGNSVIKKADFIEEEFSNKKYYYFQSDDVIGRGDNVIKETLKGLNFKFNDKDEDSFYFIKTRIKLFDDLGLDKSLKEMIYLIDFPGYGTGNFFEKGICNKVMSICNLFVFVSRNSVIKNKDNKSALDSFIQAKEKKKKFSSLFIKSSLFIFNKDVNQTSNTEDIEKAKNDIQSLIKGIDKNDINLSFFNAKYFINFCSFYNYIYNLDETLQTEYENYNNSKSNFFNVPFSNNNIINEPFADYFLKIIIEKAKEIKQKSKI